MRVAFYAPLKSPRHPVPSGDRLLGRMFIAAIERAGHEVFVASELRTWDRAGDPERQRRLSRVGRACAERLLRRWRRERSAAPHIWFTYHVYHKSPDWIGPVVCDALGIPYLIAEGSVAAKQLGGRWHTGHVAAEAALRRADAVISINPGDVAGVASVREAGSPPFALAPFIDVDGFVTPADSIAALAAFDLPDDTPRLIAVAMMREGDKLRSYRSLAASLARIEAERWHLVIVGDGPARREVETAFAGLDAARVRFVGIQPSSVVASLLQTAAIFAWPAVTEPIGMVLLEAQACGVPIVAGRRPGVANIVDEGSTAVLVEPGDEAAFAASVAALLRDDRRRVAMSERARSYVRQRHDIAQAAQALDTILRRAAALPVQRSA
jgi:glycosyltransferase involved in cell wall biosynthesis